METKSDEFFIKIANFSNTIETKNIFHMIGWRALHKRLENLPAG